MEVRGLSKALQKVAISELNEAPLRLQEDIRCIQEWAGKQPHFNSVLDPQLIVAFLRGTKFSLEKCKRKIENYYTLRSVSSQFFYCSGSLSEEVQEICQRGMAARLPSLLDSSEPERYLGRLRNEDSDVVTLRTIIEFTSMLIDMELHKNDAYVVNGMEIIFDLKEVPYSFVGQFTPNVLRTLVVLLQDACPVRVKKIYMINVPPILNTVLNGFVKLFSEKIRRRVYFYETDDIESFYKVVPQTVLPEEYGGYAGTMKTFSNQLLKEMENHQQWFEKYAEYRSDERKRIGKVSCTIDDLYCTDGSFRTLDID